jgi:arsenite methyltransferase
MLKIIICRNFFKFQHLFLKLTGFRMIQYLNDTFDLTDESIVSVYDEFPLWSSYFGAKLLDEIKYQPNITALDIGCGTGFPLIELAQRLGPSSQVFGIDPWTPASERILLKLRVMKIKNVTFFNQPAEKLPFKDSTFDLIVSNNGINNVEDAEKVLSECSRVLKPGGQFVMSVNLPGTMIEFYNVFKNILSQKGLINELGIVDAHIRSKRKSVEENLNILDASGLKVQKVVEDSFYMKYADGTAFLNHFFIKLAFLDSWKKIPPVDKLNEVFAEVEAELNTYSEKNGGLSLRIPFVVFSCYR